MRAPLFVAAIVTAALLGGGDVVAGNFEVTPVRLTLSATVKSSLLEVTNQGQEEARFQVKVFTWNENERGEMDLQETKDIVVFPTLFTLKPGLTRKLRIATQGAVAPLKAERSYRVFIEELPAPKTPGAAASAVTMLMRMSVPIFVSDDRFTSVPRIDDVSVKKSVLTFTLKNVGTRTFIARRIHLEASNKAGERVSEHEMTGWYVLPGKSRIYDVTLTPEACGAHRLTIELETEEKTKTFLPFDMPAGACSS